MYSNSPQARKSPRKKTTYDWTYRYDGNQPHAPTHLGDRTFSYDANGNQLGWTHDQNGTRRQITWDDENRIREIKDNGHRLTYTYDASGQRLTKRGPQGETGYINQWFTLRNGEVGTKHVYAGTTRVVSKLVKQDKPNAKRKGRIVYEKDQYTYHPDHLGTSAYITHTNGQVYQHLEYFPFGETWVEEHSNKQRTPYLFTAKELDEASQLYYFGARYYDPRTSVWVSADPILGDYLPEAKNSHDQELAGEGGIFNTKNLGLFTYSHNGPIIYLDPDGNERVEFSKVISDQTFNIVAYPVEDLSRGSISTEASIKSNPSGHQLSQIEYDGEIYYMSSHMGGDNQAYMNKVKEGVFSDLGDAATAATVACPACAVVTGPLALGAVAGEMAYSDNKMKTGILAIIGTVSGGAGRHAAEKLGPLSESFIKRAETSSSYRGEQAGDSIWNLLDQEQE